MNCNFLLIKGQTERPLRSFGGNSLSFYLWPLQRHPHFIMKEAVGGGCLMRLVFNEAGVNEAGGE